jgi:magnesium-transporting ATPase (P-type)
MICMLCCYWIDKYNLARRRTVMYNINSALNTFMMRTIHLTITVFILMMMGMHRFTAIKALLLVISLLLYTKPAIVTAIAKSHRQKE